MCTVVVSWYLVSLLLLCLLSSFICSMWKECIPFRGIPNVIISGEPEPETTQQLKYIFICVLDPRGL